MNALEVRLKELDGNLYNRLVKTVDEVSSMLTKYDSNFPRYTDHSISHTKEVFNLAAQLLSEEEINNLNSDEIYILSMACYLHDIGMCIPEEKIAKIKGTEDFIRYKENSERLTIEDYIRDIHHELSNKFILDEWAYLNIPDEQYAKAIGLTARGHRKVDLSNLDDYPTKFFVKNGRDFVCLPYIASIVRIADELDITNARTPALLSKYYLPNSEHSRKEWLKHIATTQVNFTEDFVLYQVKCSDHNMLAALETQFEKIQKNIHYCQKVIRTIGNTESRRFSLKLMRVIPNYEFINFDPKGIKFSFDVQNVTKTFIGEDLYEDSLAAIREAVQNSIDSCLYRAKLDESEYKPKIIITLESDKLSIQDNGLGMDEFIIENFFGRLGSSFYEQTEIKNKFDAIGQFGVGVFSYFLLSDFIEVSTKTEHGISLKFRINNDPKSYFHFYDKSERTEQGTTLVFNLRTGTEDSLRLDKVESYLRRYFRFIDFPIIFNSKESSSIIEKSSAKIDTEKEIKNHIGLEHRDYAGTLEVVPVEIKNDQLFGECGMIVRKIDKKFSFSNALALLDYESFGAKYRRNHLCEVAVSQKGVFINNYSGLLLAGIIGNINLIQKERLNINRQDFTNQDRISQIVNQFEIEIIDRIFERLQNIFDNKNLASLTQEFMDTYFSVSKSAKSKELLSILGRRFMLEVYVSNKTDYISLESLISNYSSFIMIAGFEKKKVISQAFNLPVVVCRSSRQHSGLFRTFKNVLFYYYDYNPSIVKIDRFGYQKFTKGANLEVYRRIRDFRLTSENFYHDMEPSDDKFLMSSIWYGKKGLSFASDEIFVFNSNNDFVKKLLAEKDQILQSRDVAKICNSCLNYINEFYDWKFKSGNLLEALETLNKIIEPLNKEKTFYKFSKDDFDFKNSN